jgi:hypothetical protein
VSQERNELLFVGQFQAKKGNAVRHHGRVLNLEEIETFEEGLAVLNAFQKPDLGFFSIGWAFQSARKSEATRLYSIKPRNSRL